MKRLELNSESTVKEALDIVFPQKRSSSPNNNGKFIDVGKQKFIEEFVKFEKLYIEKAKCNKLYEIYNIIPDPLHIGSYDFTYKELKDKLYNSKQESIRALLPTVKNPRGTRTICPICEDVMMSVKKKSIEHILPKSKAPHFIVTPVNLIIACQSCNGFEHQNNSKSPETSEVNPYFDFFESLLFASLPIYPCSSYCIFLLFLFQYTVVVAKFHLEFHYFLHFLKNFLYLFCLVLKIK